MNLVATLVVALGGNAILQRGERGTAAEQRKNVDTTARQIALLVKQGHRVVVTHGNGPQVGNIMIQNEAAREQVPPMPMDIAGAESQGMIGYMMQMYIRNRLREMDLDIPVVTVITQTVVDQNDPAFSNPSKPVGPFYDKEWAEKRMKEAGETWIEDSGRGWRRVVPSPDPKFIVEGPSIKALIQAGHLVVASGGGGIPVIMSPAGRLSGVEAVIDKDLAAERLASYVGADALLILTDVPGAALYFGTPSQRWLGRVSLAELEGYQAEGHFRKGSMGPKVEAIIRFLRNGGSTGVIASLDHALPAASGEAGTVATRT